MFLITTLFLLLNTFALTAESVNRSPVEIRNDKKAVSRVAAPESPGTRPRCNISAENSSDKAQPEC